MAKKLIIDKFYGSSFEAGQLVLAKMSGYPPWPAFIAKYENIPEKVFKQRRDSKTLPVIYFPEGTYGWIREKDVQVLTMKMTKEGLKSTRKKKSDQALQEAFEQLQDGYTYEQFREFLGFEEGNNLYVDENKEDVETKELETRNEEPELKKRRIKHEHTNVDDRRDVAWRFRYSLQKGLIQRKTDPNEEELDTGEQVLKELQLANKKQQFTLDILKYTKLHKVLREILKKDNLARLHQTCKEILQDWASIIEELKKEKHNTNSANASNGSIDSKGTHNRDLSDVSDFVDKRSENGRLKNGTKSAVKSDVKTE